MMLFGWKWVFLGVWGWVGVFGWGCCGVLAAGQQSCGRLRRLARVVR